MSGEVKVKSFVDIVKDFVKKMQTTIDNEDGTSGLYKYISDLLKDLGENISSELPELKSKAAKYYDTIKVEVDAKNLEKASKDIPTKINKLEKEYNTWLENCLKDIDDLHDEKTFNILQNSMQASHGNADPRIQEAYELGKANRNLQAKVKSYFEQNEYLIMLNKHANSPHKVLTDKFATTAQTCRNIIEEIKQLYKDFMVEYIKLTSDHIQNNDNKKSQEAFLDDNSLDLDRFYKDGLNFSEYELNYIDKEKGRIQIPFRSVTAKIFKEQNKILINDTDNGEKELNVSEIKEFNLTDRIRLYFALYVEQYKESIRINKNIEIFNTLISYKNNPQSLQYKIDSIKETYNSVDLEDGQSIEGYINHNWDDVIFTKSKKSDYWKEIPDEKMEEFSEYLKKAVLDISNGLLDDIAPKYSKIKFTKNTKGSFFKKRNGHYIVEMECLEPLMNGMHLVTRTELNEKAVMEKIQDSDKTTSPFYIENIKGSIVNGAWNGKYPIIVKMLKDIKDVRFKTVMKNTFVK